MRSLLKTLGDRLTYIQKRSGKNQAIFAQSLGISKGSLILYQKDRRRPDSSLLTSICGIYKVDPAWLLLGEGEPAVEEAGRRGVNEQQEAPRDLVAQLFEAEEAQAGVILTPDQRQAILKTFRELVSRDVRVLQELLKAFPQGEKRERQ